MAWFSMRGLLDLCLPLGGVLSLDPPKPGPAEAGTVDDDDEGFGEGLAEGLVEGLAVGLGAAATRDPAARGGLLDLGGLWSFILPWSGVDVKELDPCDQAACRSRFLATSSAKRALC